MKTFLTCFKRFALPALLFLSPLALAHSMHDHHAPPKKGVVVAPQESAPANATVNTSANKQTSRRVKILTKKPTDGLEQLIQQYSRSGNDELLVRGQKLLDARLSTPTPEDWLHAAWLAQAEHRFDHANTFISKVLDAQPRHAQALLLQASIAMVQGKDQRARETCRKITLAVEPIVGSACLARLSTPGNEQQQALNRLLKLPLRLQAPALRSWVMATIAELAAAVGQDELAQEYFESTIQLRPTAQIRVAYADFLISKDAHEKAIELIDAAEHAPALALRRIMASQQLGHDVSVNVARFDRLFRQWHEQKDYRHAREMALFYLDVLPDAQLAQTLAEENVKRQQEPEDVALLQESRNRG